jgi:hypothetical protein
MTEKRNIHALIEKEAPSLNNLLDPNEVKELTGEFTGASPASPTGAAASTLSSS